MSTKIKLWFVRRWLPLLPLEELKDAYEYRDSFKQLNDAFDRLSNAMIEMFYKEGQPEGGIEEKAE